MFWRNFCVNKIDDKGNTPLIYAAQEGRANVAKFLVNKGAVVDKVGRSRKTPLIEAIIGGHLSAVNYLVEMGANVDRLAPDGNSPLAAAVRCQHRKIVELLVNMEADVCKVGDKGKPPLSWAVITEDFGLVEFLLENGAEDTVQAALVEAVEGRNFEIVKFLMEKCDSIEMGSKFKEMIFNKVKESHNLDLERCMEKWNLG